MMSMIPARKLMRQYREVFATAAKTGEPIVVLAENKPIGAVISNEQLEELESLKETAAILAIPGAKERIMQGVKEANAGKLIPLEALD